MADTSDQRQLWKVFSAALDAELREDTVIRGASGLKHAAQAIAVDDRSNRLIIVSAEANPRTAALMRVDVQATLPETKVIVARPVAIDISTLVRTTLAPFGLSKIGISQAKSFIQNLKEMSDEDKQSLISDEARIIFENTKRVYDKMKLPIINQVLDVVSQSEQLPWSEIMAVLDESPTEGVLDFSHLIKADSLSADLSAGVCPIPLYEFSENDFGIFTADRQIDEARERLRSLGIHQYFYPPADQIALGLVDQGLVREHEIKAATAQAPGLGHPFGEAELVTSPSGLADVIAQLQGLGYVAEGEHGFEVSDKGRTVRSLVKFRPREGFLTKLLNRISFNASVTPKDFM